MLSDSELEFVKQRFGENFVTDSTRIEYYPGPVSSWDVGGDVPWFWKFIATLGCCFVVSLVAGVLMNAINRQEAAAVKGKSYFSTLNRLRRPWIDEKSERLGMFNSRVTFREEAMRGFLNPLDNSGLARYWIPTADSRVHVTYPSPGSSYLNLFMDPEFLEPDEMEEVLKAQFVAYLRFKKGSWQAKAEKEIMEKTFEYLKNLRREEKRINEEQERPQTTST